MNAKKAKHLRKIASLYELPPTAHTTIRSQTVNDHRSQRAIYRAIKQQVKDHA